MALFCSKCDHKTDLPSESRLDLTVLRCYELNLATMEPNEELGEEFEVPEHGRALLMYLLSEIGRVYWNREQKEWDLSAMPDPKIPGLRVRPFNWADDNALPNFVFGDVEIRWYKHPGRGLSCNRDLDASGWIKWFGECLSAIQAEEAGREDAVFGLMQGSGNAGS